jgi:outer membrane immunogenic protein
MRASTFKAIAAAFTVMTAIPSASAADLAARPYTKAPMMAEVYNWTGFYIGGNAGYSWGRSRTDASYFNFQQHHQPAARNWYELVRYERLGGRRAAWL